MNCKNDRYRWNNETQIKASTKENLTLTCGKLAFKSWQMPKRFYFLTSLWNNLQRGNHNNAMYEIIKGLYSKCICI